MNKPIRFTAAAAALAVALPVWAASGQLDSFSANTTTIRAGESVDFSASFSISTSSWSGGGSNPTEPAPQEGYQTWDINWYSTWAETVTGVQLQAAGMSFNDFPSVPAGGGYSNSWSFSVLFSDPGTYVIDLTGGWSTLTESYSSNESASRTCYNTDPGGTDLLACDSWSYSYYDPSDYSNFDSSFSPLSLTIEVAAVPEPASYAMLIAGLMLVGGLVRHRRR